MNLLRSTVAAAALFLASQAHASVLSVSFGGTLDVLTQGLTDHYAEGMQFSGMLNIDDHGPLGGTLQVGGNTISFKDCDVFLLDSGFSTKVSVMGGDYWAVGGVLDETWKLGITGLQLNFFFPTGMSYYTPLTEIFATQPYSKKPWMALNYGGYEQASGYMMAQAAPAAAVPEPASALLMALGMGAVAAARRYRRR